MVSVLMFKAGLGGLVSTNGVPTVSSRSGIVSVGPIVVTNGCSINFAADQSVLKVELTAEINKAKFELAEENRNRMYAIRDEIEKMRKDAVADARSRIKQEFSTLKSDVVKWYDELKDILDIRLNIFTWVIGILVALFGVAAPVVMEVMRGRDYERLKTELREDMENMQNEFVVEKKIIDDAKEKWQMKMADVAKTEANFIVLQNQLEQGAKNLEQNLQTLKSEITARKEEVEEVRRSLEQQKKGIEEALNTYSTYAQNIFIEEAIDRITTEQIKAKVEEHYKARKKAPVVIVDYLQIIKGANERGTDKQNTDAAILDLKHISRDYNTPVIVISSFNRDNYDNTANMAAFKESGGIEYSADTLIGIQYRGQGEKNFNEENEASKIHQRAED